MLGAVVEELLADDHRPAASLRLLGEALVEVAPGGRREAIARLLAALGTERTDVLAAEQQLRLAHAADPDDGPVIDHLGWYAGRPRRRRSCRRAVGGARADTGPARRARGRRRVRRADRRAPAGTQRPVLVRVGSKVSSATWANPGRFPCPIGCPRCTKAGSFVQRRQGEERADVMALTMARALDPDDEDSVEEAF